MSSEENKYSGTVEELRKTVDRLKADNERLVQLAQQADAANKAKSDFLAMISHEIRTPMNGVIGLSELLLDTELNGKQKHFSSLILTSARNLLTLINSLLDFSKIEAEMMELDIARFGLREMIEELMALYNVATERKNLEVYAEIDPRVSSFYMGDNYRIRQILVNLLGNAIKFTEEGAVVLKISYEGVAEDGRDQLRFEVRDSGPGIPDDKLDRLFKPFSQVDASSTRRFGGTGLGLSICQKLVELMDGKIGVESEKAKGSTFWFFLPLQPVAAEAQETREVEDVRRKERTKDSPERLLEDTELSEVAPLLLVVDDDETNRFVMETVLQRAGARVLSAKNGQEAIEMFETGLPDLILMDCQMPVMDGFEACRRIHDKSAKLARKRPSIVALTADATLATKQHCKEVGMVDYLTKPLEFGKLQRVIDSWLPGSGLKVIAHHQDIPEKVSEPAGEYASQDDRIDPKVLERLKKNMGDISPVIRVFLDTLPQRLAELKRAVAEGDHEGIRRIAHTLKGSTSQFGAKYMSALCYQAENMGKSKQLENVESVSEKISHAADQLADFLTEELDKK